MYLNHGCLKVDAESKGATILMDTIKNVLNYWKYCYLKSLAVKIQIHVIRFGTHICNSGNTPRRLMIMT